MVTTNLDCHLSPCSTHWHVFDAAGGLTLLSAPPRRLHVSWHLAHVIHENIHAAYICVVLGFSTPGSWGCLWVGCCLWAANGMRPISLTIGHDNTDMEAFCMNIEYQFEHLNWVHHVSICLFTKPSLQLRLMWCFKASSQCFLFCVQVSVCSLISCLRYENRDMTLILFAYIKMHIKQANEQLTKRWLFSLQVSKSKQ